MRSSWIALVTLAALTFTPVLASAKLSKEQRAELQVFVDELKASKSAQALAPTILLWGKLADKKSLDELRAFKSHEDPSVRLAAGLALMELKDKGADKFVEEQLGASADLYMTLEQVISLLEDKQELKLISTLLKKAKPETRQAIFRYLAGQRGEHFKVLVQAIEGKDAAAREDAIKAIMAAPSEEIGLYLDKLLKNKSEEVQLATLHLGLKLAALNPNQRVKVTSLLEDSLNHKSAAISTTATVELAKLNNVKAIDKLISLAAAEADAAKRTAYLELVLEKATAGVKLKKDAIAPLKAKLTAPQEQVMFYRLSLLAGDIETLAKVVEMFGSDNYEERLISAQALGYSGSDQAAALLGKGLFEGNNMMRLYSAQGLAILAKPASLESLQMAIQREKNPDIKIAVIRAIGKLKSQQAFNILQFQSTDSNPKVRAALLDALADTGLADGFRVVEIIIRDRDPKLQWHAFVTGMSIAPEKTLAYKTTVLRDPPADFLDQLDKLQGKSKEDIFTVLISHESSQIQGPAIGFMLNHRHDPLYIKLLRQVLSNKDAKLGIRRNILARLAADPQTEDITLFESLAADKKQPKELTHHASLILAKLARKDTEASFRGMTASSDEAVKAYAAYGLASVLDQ